MEVDSEMKVHEEFTTNVYSVSDVQMYYTCIIVHLCVEQLHTIDH